MRTVRKNDAHDTDPGMPTPPDEWATDPHPGLDRADTVPLAEAPWYDEEDGPESEEPSAADLAEWLKIQRLLDATRIYEDRRRSLVSSPRSEGRGYVVYETTTRPASPTRGIEPSAHRVEVRALAELAAERSAPTVLLGPRPRRRPSWMLPSGALTMGALLVAVWWWIGSKDPHPAQEPTAAPPTVEPFTPGAAQAQALSAAELGVPPSARKSLPRTAPQPTPRVTIPEAVGPVDAKPLGTASRRHGASVSPMTPVPATSSSSTAAAKGPSVDDATKWSW